jgi:hypothetical protein
MGKKPDWGRRNRRDDVTHSGDGRLGAEPSRDPDFSRAVADAEHELYPALPNGALAAPVRERIVSDARPLLARLAARFAAPRWWEWTARWSRAAIPLGAAAGIAAVLAVVASRDRTNRVIRERTLQGQPPIVRAAVSGTQTSELLESVVGPATDEWLISQVFAGTALAKLRDEIRDSATPRD